jgi:hypothetical protein
MQAVLRGGIQRLDFLGDSRVIPFLAFAQNAGP